MFVTNQFVRHSVSQWKTHSIRLDCLEINYQIMRFVMGPQVIDQPIFIDFEASSLEQGSFPIEVGIAWINNGEVETWAELIRPAPSWDASSWSLDSQEVHGISREQLKTASSAVEVARRLHESIAGRLVISDAASFDQKWLDTLFESIGKEGCVRLIDFDAYVAKVGLERLRKIYLRLDELGTPHRAGPDARRLAYAIMEN